MTDAPITVADLTERVKIQPDSVRVSAFFIPLDLHDRFEAALKRRGNHHGLKAYVLRTAIEIFCNIDEGNIDRAQALLNTMRKGQVKE